VDALDRAHVHAERGRHRLEPDGSPDLDEITKDLPLLAVESRIVDLVDRHRLEDGGDVAPIKVKGSSRTSKALERAPSWIVLWKERSSSAE
jgi:hypothetical protein